jgi:hypothetical protein
MPYNNKYNIIFSSRNSNATVNNGTAQSVTYSVNWSAILDSRYKRFKCNFVFKSEIYGGALTQTGFVNMNFGNVEIYNGESMSQNIGIVSYVPYNTTNSFISATNNDNNEFYIDFPINRNVTVNIINFSGGAFTVVQHYALIMSLEGIED